MHTWEFTSGKAHNNLFRIRSHSLETLPTSSEDEEQPLAESIVLDELHSKHGQLRNAIETLFLSSHAKPSPDDSSTEVSLTHHTVQ